MKRGLLVGIALGLGAVATAATALVVRSHSARAARDAEKMHLDRPVPVNVAIASVRDVKVYVEGLGTVTPLYTVNVRPLVDGRLEKVEFTEGQFVKKGATLAVVDPRPFENQMRQAQASRAKDDAALKNARITLRRDTDLMHEGLTSQQQVDNDHAAAESAAAAVSADDAQIGSASLLVDYAHVTSPIDGVTGIRLVDPGNVVHAADSNPLVVVTQLDPISVIFTLPEDDLARVNASRRRGTPRVTALSRDGSQTLGEGDLTVLDNQINQQTATLRLKAAMANPESRLWPNQFVKARMLLDVRGGALVVPAAALQRGPKGTFVYVVEHEHAQTREVTADEIEGDEAIVTQGLAAGATVVVDGQSQLKPNTKVAVQSGGGAIASAPAASGRKGRR